MKQKNFFFHFGNETILSESRTRVYISFSNKPERFGLFIGPMVMAD